MYNKPIIWPLGAWWAGWVGSNAGQKWFLCDHESPWPLLNLGLLLLGGLEDCELARSLMEQTLQQWSSVWSGTPGNEEAIPFPGSVGVWRGGWLQQLLHWWGAAHLPKLKDKWNLLIETLWGFFCNAVYLRGQFYLINKAISESFFDVERIFSK